MKQSFGTIGVSVAALGAMALFAMQSGHAAPKPTKGEMEVDYRQSLYTVLGGNFGPLGAMAEGKVPFNAAEARVRAHRVAFLAPMLKEAFPADSDGADHTAAKHEIWTDPDEFAKKLQTLIDRTAALATAADTGDADKIKDAIEETGKACKSCHEKFRKKDEDIGGPA
ncbi:MAG: c-type cytochrome [Steroidobacterales bacterium]